MFNIFKFEINPSFNLGNLFKRKKFSKLNVNILFIDDANFPVVEKLQKAGWAVKKINDLIDIEDEDIQRSQIIFVDYRGVGKNLSETEQGIGIIKALKSTYGDSKRVILYSEYGRFNLDINMRAADNQMPKNSDTYEFITMIESEIKKIK